FGTGPQIAATTPAHSDEGQTQTIIRRFHLLILRSRATRKCRSGDAKASCRQEVASSNHAEGPFAVAQSSRSDQRRLIAPKEQAMPYRRTPSSLLNGRFRFRPSNRK